MEDIKIIKKGEVFTIVQGDKSAAELTFDEALGLIATIMMPKEKHCLRWLKTKEEHILEKEYLSTLK